MLSGDVLSQWLQRRNGSIVAGSRISLTLGGFLRVSDEVNSRPVQVALPVMHGGQAAVARAVDRDGAVMALRVQAVSSTQEKARQMERLVNMVTVATAAKERPDRFPAVLPVAESFVMVVPGTEVPVTGPQPEYELWCDLMAWCPHDLNDWQQAAGQVRTLPVVLGAFLPVLDTVRATHEDLGIVHRDITPNNVLVDEQGRLLLADWGIAHGLDAGQTSTYTQLVGNRGFSLPPEMLAGDPSVGRYTDAWYLGSLLAWMLTGQPPGPQHGPTWLPPGMPGGPVGDQVQAVVQGLCQPDPRRRMGLAQAGAHLHAVVQGARVAPLAVVAMPSVAPSGAATVAYPGLLPADPSTGGQTGSYPPYGSTSGTQHLAYVTVGPSTGRKSTKGLWFTLGAATVCVALGVGAAKVWPGFLDDAASDSDGTGAQATGSGALASGAQTPLETGSCIVGTWEIDAADLHTQADLQAMADDDGTSAPTVEGTMTVSFTSTRQFTSGEDALFSWADDPDRDEVPYSETKEGVYTVDGDTVVFKPTNRVTMIDGGTSRVMGDVEDTTWTVTCTASTLTVLTIQDQHEDDDEWGPVRESDATFRKG